MSESFHERTGHDEVFEDSLRAALARIDAPGELTGKIMARVRRRPGLPRRALALGASVAVLIGSVIYHENRVAQTRQSERQLVFALQLTSQKLSVVSHRLRKTSVHMQIQENL